MTKPEVKISLTLTLQEKDQQLILEGDEFIFGRNEKSDVIIRDPSFSRSHLKIFLNSENKVCISDLGSPNGTFINGQRISSHGTSHIRTNDIISIDNSNTRIAINKIEIKALEQVGGNDLSLVISKITEDAKLKAEAIIQAAIEEAQRIHREQEIENKKKLALAEEEALNRAIQNFNDQYKDKIVKKIQEETSELRVQFEKEKERLLTLANNEQDKLTNLEDKSKVLTNTILKLEDEIIEKKKDMNLMEQSLKDKTEEQIKIVSMQIETKKNEWKKEQQDYQEKINGAKAELQNLFNQFETKKNEEQDSINQLQKSKKNLTLEIDELKNIHANYSEIYKNEKATLALLAEEKEKIEKSTQETQSIKLNEEKKLKMATEQVSQLTNELSQLQSQKNTLAPDIENLKSKYADITKQYESAHIALEKAQEEHKILTSKIEKMQIEEKNLIKDNLQHFKESEEKRIQEALQVEITKISKLREDSLNLVIELEDSITKEISMASSKIFATKIGVEKFREIAPDFEKSLRTSLQKGVLNLLKNNLDTNSKKATLSHSLSRRYWKPFSLGLAISAILFGIIPFYYQQFLEKNSPEKLKLAMELKEKEKALKVIPKYEPVKKIELGANFVDSVVYTENFCETFALEDFRSQINKEGSIYLYKNWQIEEEKAIQSFSLIFSMVDRLKERRDKIHPDYVQQDLAKMRVIEKETFKKLESIIGNEVRVDAAVKFLKRYYQNFKKSDL